MGLLEKTSTGDERTPAEIIEAESELQRTQLNVDNDDPVIKRVEAAVKAATQLEDTTVSPAIRKARLEEQANNPEVQSSIGAVSDLQGASNKVRSQQEDVSWFDSLTTMPTEPADVNRMESALAFLLRKRNNGEYYRSASDIQTILDKVKSLRMGGSSLMERKTTAKAR